VDLHETARVPVMPCSRHAPAPAGSFPIVLVVGGAVGFLVLCGFAYLGRLLLITPNHNQARVIPGFMPITPDVHNKPAKDDAASEVLSFSPLQASAHKPPRPSPLAICTAGMVSPRGRDSDMVFDMSDGVQRAAASLASTVRAYAMRI
jgi:hypothetical protein